MTLRPATEADIPHVLRLVRGLAEYERMADKAIATDADFHTLLFGPIPRAHAILAEPPGHPPVGIAIYYYTISTFAGRPGLFLEDLYVEPAHRGTGLGLALLRRLAAIAVEERCVSIDWRVLEWNQPAIDFYQSLGATRMTEWHVRQLQGDALHALAKGNTHG
ncbi:MAG TPA: GNAT family N-acetyltransferase [Rhodopila sp.]|uniref:GNAT family N-acetyltransferase n=1 Tax=Rhodopila sp. TaxID=2480087 RepID=UPI002C203336|nr:GNAT family N-acetyltransferase [Rhodopila sp.]HVY18085.1 GNAT family N-acetyltransferase [Rhodopila sp.]